EGYKGYGLSVMVEILCGLLTGLGFGVEPTGCHNDGCFMAVFKVDAFRPLAEFKKNIGAFVQYLKATKPAEGHLEVEREGQPWALLTVLQINARVFTRPFNTVRAGRRCCVHFEDLLFSGSNDKQPNRTTARTRATVARVRTRAQYARRGRRSSAGRRS